MNKFRACLKSYVSLYIYTISENVKNYSAFIWQSSEFSKIRVLKVHYFHLPRKKNLKLKSWLDSNTIYIVFECNELALDTII